MYLYFFFAFLYCSLEGSCGQSPYHDYNDWPLEFMPEETYEEGSNITVSSYMDTHHNGHIEVRYCDFTQWKINHGEDAPATPDCFDGNTLKFVEDIGVWADGATQPRPTTGDWQKMPADPNHPERGYLSGGQSVGSKNTFTMIFQLPLNLVGDEILLQWKYIT